MEVDDPQRDRMSHSGEQRKESPADEDLIRGGEAGLKELVRRYEVRFVRVAWGTGLVNTIEEAEDVAQEAWKRILERCRQGIQIEYFSGYAVRTIYNLARDRLRRKQRGSNREGALREGEAVIDSKQNPEEERRRRERAHQREAFWAKMWNKTTHGDRLVLELWKRGLKPKEIAGVLKRTPAAVHASCYRIRRVGRQITKEQGIASLDDLFDET
jgi:RNA polymerase sigma factor (sigma-70 family)